MKKIFLLAFGLLVSATLLLAQTIAPQIQFETLTHNFGKIPDNQKVTYKFKFLNAGSQPLIITNVEAACGCTAPSWPKTPFTSGQQGEIEVEFNPAGYRGFSKTITVSSNSQGGQIVLTISGEAFSPNAADITKQEQDKYKAKMGVLSLVSSHVGFGNVFPQEIKKNYIDIKNTGNVPVKVGFFGTPAHIMLKAIPEVLPPNGEGKIEVTFDAPKKNDWDYVFDRVYITLDNQRTFDYALNITAVITEDFNKLTDAERQAAPVAAFDVTSYDFGEVKAGSSVKMSFKLTNNGKTPLVIRKVKASCGCTAVEPQDKVILPGKSTTIESVFDSTGRTGDQSKSITIITNDPNNSRSVIWIKGKVIN